MDPCVKEMNQTYLYEVKENMLEKTYLFEGTAVKFKLIFGYRVNRGC